MTSDEQFNLVMNRLEAILKLLALQITFGKKASEAAPLLERAGLDRKLMSEVLNTSQNSVRALLSKTKKAQTSKKKEAAGASAGQ